MDSTITPDKDVLLVEYQVCLADASQLDADIWQSGTMFIALSVIAFSFLIQTQAKNWGDFVVYVLLSVFGLILLFIWHQLANGWLRLAHINFFRMREIESILGMQRERLIKFLDTGQADSQQDAELFSKFKKQFPGNKLGGPIGVQRILKWLTWFIISGWIILLIKQIMYLLLTP